MVHKCNNITTVGIYKNGVIEKESIYRDYAKYVKLLADSDTDYFTVINTPYKENEELENIMIIFSDEYNIVLNYNGLCLLDVKSITISPEENITITIETDYETNIISAADAFDVNEKGDYCVALDLNFEDNVEGLSDRPSVFYNIRLLKTPDKIENMNYPCFTTEVTNAVNGLNFQHVTIKALLSPLMIDPVVINSFGVDDYETAYKKIASTLHNFEQFYKHLHYTNNIIVYDRKKKMLNLKHIRIDQNMKQLAVYDEFINSTVGVSIGDQGANIYQYYDLLNSNTLLESILTAGFSENDNVVMVGNAPIIGRSKFYNMNEEEITDEITNKVDTVFNILDSVATKLDMNSLLGFKFNSLIGIENFDDEFNDLLDSLDAEDAVIVYEPVKFANFSSDHFHLIFIQKQK